jgi:ribosomal protein L4
MKPTANYKMSKQTKRTLALTHFSSEDQRNAWKRAMIDAELCAAIQPKRESKGRNQNSGTANYNTNATGTASTASE